jgi:proline iminopeptidase
MVRPRRFRLFLLLTGVLASPVPAQGAHQRGELFPAAQPFETGHLKVSELHTIGYALCGNPLGKPVFVLHGGPGVGCYPRLTQYFNPDKFLIVLHDQRGAGRSRPPGELRENTTPHLVADIERLREHLKIDGKILLFGGSWGSTLALAYAETHPEQVAGMVLRGIFTGTQAETDNVYAGGAMRLYFPDAVARLEAVLPPGCSEFKPKPLLELFTNGDDAVVQKVGHAWIRFAIKTGKLRASDEQVEQGWGDYDPRPGAKIDCYYASNGFFLEENQLLRDAHKLKDIPVTIINGRYDVVCPPITAWKLHQRLPKSKLIIVEGAGHSEGEEGTTRALVEAVAEFE